MEGSPSRWSNVSYRNGRRKGKRRWQAMLLHSSASVLSPSTLDGAGISTSSLRILLLCANPTQMPLSMSSSLEFSVWWDGWEPDSFLMLLFLRRVPESRILRFQNFVYRSQKCSNLLLHFPTTNGKRTRWSRLRMEECLLWGRLSYFLPCYKHPFKRPWRFICLHPRETLFLTNGERLRQCSLVIVLGVLLFILKADYTLSIERGGLADNV